MLGLKEQDLKILEKLVKKGVEAFQLRVELSGPNTNAWVHDFVDEDQQEGNQLTDEEEDGELNPEDLCPHGNRNPKSLEDLQAKLNPEVYSLSKIDEMEEEYKDSTYRFGPSALNLENLESARGVAISRGSQREGITPSIR